ncbi:hypothetical protein MAP00_002306 [Monascus purpureus]|nr:hypothetical protein MAP00_002306 [Monascus purpureus]
MFPLFDSVVVLVKILGAAGVALVVISCWIFCPPYHPRNIPAVPLWVTLLPFIYDVDQECMYKKYIQKPLLEHGAVKIFFGGQWNVLVQRSTYLAEVFRNEETYQKSGNQKKIPHSILAEYLGDNIISSRGDDWRVYREVIKPALQARFDGESIAKNARQLCALLRQSQVENGQRGCLVQDILQRYSIANIATVIFRTDLGIMQNPHVHLHVLLQQVKREIFQPIFLNFPVLDQLGSLFPSRVRARQLVVRFSEELQRILYESRGKSSLPSGEPKTLGDRLVSARERNVLTQKQFRDNLNVVFVAGQENPQLAMISTLYLLGKYPEAQSRLRREVDECGSGRPIEAICNELPYLTAVVYESIRLFPPISQLINRRVSQSGTLGSRIYLPQGTYVGYNSYSTNRDPATWGLTADQFLPGRWGSTNEQISRRLRVAKARAEFISFHGGGRACLGEKFAVMEIKVALATLVRELSWTLDPEWTDRMTPVSRQKKKKP